MLKPIETGVHCRHRSAPHPDVSAATLSLARLEGRVALAAAILFLTLAALQHIVKPELAPARHMISEYAIDRHGWPMRLAFYSLDLTCFLSALAVWPFLADAAAGPVLLVVAGAGAAEAGLFVTDPLGTPKEVSTPAGLWHFVFSLVFISLIPSPPR